MSVSILSYFFSCFFLVSKLYNSCLQIIPSISDHLKFMASIDIGDIQWLGYQEGSVPIFSYFFRFFFWSVNCTNLVCIFSCFEHGKCLIYRLLVFSFLVFSVFKYLKSVFLSIFPELEVLQFWSVNYICQVCKLYFYFGHVQNFGQYLYLSVNSESDLLLAFVKYVVQPFYSKLYFFVLFGG